MKKVRTHTFNGITYTIQMGEIDGWADTNDKYAIIVSCLPNTQNELITIIHEAMHAGNWSKHEETIDRSSAEIGRLLWRLGYRR